MSWAGVALRIKMKRKTPASALTDPGRDRPGRVDMSERTCQGCDAVFTPGPNEHNPRKWCSPNCRMKTYRQTHPKYRAQSIARSNKRWHATYVPVGPYLIVCAGCGVEFEARTATALCCSQKCGRKHTSERLREMRAIWDQTPNGKRARRASIESRREYLAECVTEAFTYAEIFERDGWICGLCHTPVDPELTYPDPMSKSLDHVVPVSLGGDHVRMNTQLAHLGCNCRKGNRVA